MSDLKTHTELQGTDLRRDEVKLEAAGFKDLINLIRKVRETEKERKKARGFGYKLQLEREHVSCHRF